MPILRKNPNDLPAIRLKNAAPLFTVLAISLAFPVTATADESDTPQAKSSKGFHIGPPGAGITIGGGKGLQIGTDKAGVKISREGIRIGTDEKGVKIDGEKARVGTDNKGFMIGGGEGVRAGTSEKGVKIDGDGARAGTDDSGLVIDGEGVDIRNPE